MTIEAVVNDDTRFHRSFLGHTGFMHANDNELARLVAELNRSRAEGMMTMDQSLGELVRVQAGDLETVEGLAFGAWQSRLNAGDTAIMIAPTNESARELSERAQAYRIGRCPSHYDVCAARLEQLLNTQPHR